MEQRLLVDHLANVIGDDQAIVRCDRLVLRKFARHRPGFLTGSSIVRKFLSIGIAGAGSLQGEIIVRHWITNYTVQMGRLHAPDNAERRRCGIPAFCGASFSVLID